MWYGNIDDKKDFDKNYTQAGFIRKGYSKAVIYNLDQKEKTYIQFMFNPPEYQLQRSNTYAEVKTKGRENSMFQFVGGEAQTLSMEMFFDTTGNGEDVRPYVEKIVRLSRKDGKKDPPKLLLVWGTLVFKCIIEKISQKIDYFNPIGWPLRARLNVTFKEIDHYESGNFKNTNEFDFSETGCILREGETLQGVAGVVYGDNSKWRDIAEASNIDNPLTTQIGQALELPKTGGK